MRTYGVAERRTAPSRRSRTTGTTLHSSWRPGGPLSAPSVLTLQNLAGNEAVSALIDAKRVATPVQRLMPSSLFEQRTTLFARKGQSATEFAGFQHRLQQFEAMTNQPLQVKRRFLFKLRTDLADWLARRGAESSRSSPVSDLISEADAEIAQLDAIANRDDVTLPGGPAPAGGPPIASASGPTTANEETIPPHAPPPTSPLTQQPTPTLPGPTAANEETTQHPAPPASLFSNQTLASDYGQPAGMSVTRASDYPVTASMGTAVPMSAANQPMIMPFHGQPAPTFHHQPGGAPAGTAGSLVPKQAKYGKQLLRDVEYKAEFTEGIALLPKWVKDLVVGPLSEGHFSTVEEGMQGQFGWSPAETQKYFHKIQYIGTQYPDKPLVQAVRTEEERKQYELLGGSTVKQGDSKIPYDTAELISKPSGKGYGIFVMDNEGRIFAASHKVGLFHHSSFLAGSSVAAAGEIKIENGVIKVVTNKSGHYKPSDPEMIQFFQELESRGVDLNSVEYRTMNLQTRQMEPYPGGAKAFVLANQS